MPSYLEPADALDDCLEAHLARYSGRSSTIYLAVLLLLCGALGATPFIRVGVTIEARGVIRPALDKHEVVAGTAGTVGQVLTRENRVVAAGDPLITIESGTIETRLRSVMARIEETDAAIRDLMRVSELDPTRTGWFDGGAAVLEDLIETARVREELRLHRDQLATLEARVSSLGQEAERAERLHALGLLSRSDVEERRLALSAAQADLAAMEARQRNEWQARLASLRQSRLELLDQKAALAAESALYTVRAPVSGTVEQLLEISPGSYVRAGQTLAVISPDAPLVAEVYVPSSRFGLLEKGMPVRLLIDAYDYVDWGFIPGRIAELPDDHILVDGTPMFRTLLELEATRLALPNGTTRELVKGMTLQARFVVAERSLWNLIRDDINDWFNPSAPAE